MLTLMNILLTAARVTMVTTNGLFLVYCVPNLNVSLIDAKQVLSFSFIHVLELDRIRQIFPTHSHPKHTPNTPILFYSILFYYTFALFDSIVV